MSSSKNESLSLSLLAWNRFYNLETIHSRAYPAVLEELKENTIYNNVPKTALAGLILVLRRDAPSPNSRVKRARIYSWQESSFTGPSSGNQRQISGWRQGKRAGGAPEDLNGMTESWGLRCAMKRKMGEYFQHHLLYIFLSFLLTPPSYFIKVLALPRETSHLWMLPITFFRTESRNWPACSSFLDVGCCFWLQFHSLLQP